MNMEAIETFIILCELKSFTKTASKLYVAQSTITNRIAELEKELGQPLFKRNNKSMELTLSGKIYQDYARRIIQLNHSALSSMNRDNAIYSRRIHVGTTNTIYECHLKNRILSFVSNNYDVGVKLTMGHSDELLDMLTKDLIDYIYIYLPFRRKGFVCDCFCVDELVLVCNYNDLLYEKGILKNQLQSLRYIYCNFALQDVGMFIRELFPRNYQFCLEIDNSTKVLDYVLDGAGYSFLPLSLVQIQLKRKELRSIPLLDFESPKINNYVIHRENQSRAI